MTAAPEASPAHRGRGESLRRLAEGLLAALVLLAFAAVGGFSAGYDDEFYNIMAVARWPDLPSLIHGINASDVHPPLSYVANALLYRLTGSWSAVRALSGLAVAASLLAFLHAATRQKRDLLLPCLLVVGLHPTLLMWTASLRWTGTFTALLLLALTLILRNPPRPAVFWGALALLLVVMFHTNYEAALIGPALVGLALHARRARLRAEWPLALVALVAAAALCVPQLMAALATHLRRRSGQTGGLLASLSGAAQGYLVNMGLFPLSVAGVLNAASICGLGALVALTARLRLLRDPLVLFWLACTLLLIVAGLGVKPRNLTPLVPVLFLLLTTLSLTSGRPRLAAGLLGLLVLTQMVGLAHLVLHRDTGKGSWNLPVREVVEAVRGQSCTGVRKVAVHDLVLANWLAEQPGLDVISPYTGTADTARVAAGDCLTAVLTFRGSLRADAVARMMAALPQTPARETLLAPDPYASLKRRFDPDIPDVYVRLLDFGPLAAPVDLGPWHRPAALPRAP